MGETFLNWLELHYHGLALLLAGAAISWFFANRYFHWTNRIKIAQEHGDKIDNEIIPRLDRIVSSIDSLRSAHNGLVIYLKGKDNKLDLTFFTSNSPIQLTPAANEVLFKSGAKYFIDKNINNLIEQIEINKFKTALDIQSFAPALLWNYSYDTSFDGIKNYLFKNPYFNSKSKDGEDLAIPLDLDTIINIMGIYLRDIYLEKHPQLKPLE